MEIFYSINIYTKWLNLVLDRDVNIFLQCTGGQKKTKMCVCFVLSTYILNKNEEPNKNRYVCASFKNDCPYSIVIVRFLYD